MDIDGDGEVDFVIPGSPTQIDVIAQASNQVLTYDEFGTHYAADLVDGSFIGAEPDGGGMWNPGSSIMSACFNAGGIVCFGNFLGGVEYLGVEFDIGGNTHYGWIEIESRERFVFVRIHRWAYESEPGVPLQAGLIPEPSSVTLLLASLALGAQRRRTDP
jgi:hypothetical protein